MQQQLLSSLGSVPFDADSNRRSFWPFARLIRRFRVLYDIILCRAAAVNADHDRLIIAIDCVHFSRAPADDDDALPLSCDCGGLPFVAASVCAHQLHRSKSADERINQTGFTAGLEMFLFTALHGMQRGLTMRFLSVRPSVCPSVKRVHCDKTEEKSVQIFIPCDR